MWDLQHISSRREPNILNMELDICGYYIKV